MTRPVPHLPDPVTVAAVLNDINRVRFALDLNPVHALLRGVRMSPYGCPVARTLALGLDPLRYRVQVSPLSLAVYLRVGPPDPAREAPGPLVVRRDPAPRTRQFITTFDTGGYGGMVR